ncbi:hypothetical protein SAMN05444320_11362 [Streptoalloteichus hindustanus]|uniref:Uncharacterized protein n=1 Tax=Streptoalloteichus hindustanus TaxID=2017 RepID=A0A1M5MCP4_STRHI|nr:hypothetical protein SAMN05444320_11362 [Streptoalloteichus hindustanus]
MWLAGRVWSGSRVAAILRRGDVGEDLARQRDSANASAWSRATGQMWLSASQ